MIAEELLAFTWILTEAICLGMKNEIIKPGSQVATMRITGSFHTLPAPWGLQTEYSIYTEKTYKMNMYQGLMVSSFIGVWLYDFRNK